jgi:hypothetical protein
MHVGIVPQISEGQEILDRCKALLDAFTSRRIPNLFHPPFLSA